MAKILLIGLDDAAATQIGRLILQENHEFECKPMDVRNAQTPGVDLVLASGDDPNCLKLLPVMRAQRYGLPFIVVTRLPETTHWLDALEAGATDYWAAPFERVQFRWLLDSALDLRMRAAAA